MCHQLYTVVQQWLSGSVVGQASTDTLPLQTPVQLTDGCTGPSSKPQVLLEPFSEQLKLCLMQLP